ncbi:hypothetical protein IF599_003024 [Salmonella enterica]|uniref:hypothetical protein n=1 Tax=Salmonella enterica TaxID=28901 RepID=UPI00109E307F|nr:hypothetical protein [Salmonella enterica]EAU5117686.1 hypothetical protein [Salmonella enterica subsp. enterica serovar Montevideo]EBL6309667.1 hypothetical protein [Salmonella enterica subsp. enterica serovar Rubislaw]ECH9424473.1 hypothetical protein [Salmonella enterica subsp. enterica serovar Javiana]ECM2104789.1 hypothetical protein [Salmonella enterica subsp. enterica serovar Muenchen]ECO0665829.1 hypothetical protein [Salmonella enterica subsp. enterica serovar Give]ECX5675693.1 hy
MARFADEAIAPLFDFRIAISAMGALVDVFLIYRIATPTDPESVCEIKHTRHSHTTPETQMQALCEKYRKGIIQDR